MTFTLIEKDDNENPSCESYKTLNVMLFLILKIGQ